MYRREQAAALTSPVPSARSMRPKSKHFSLSRRLSAVTLCAVSSWVLLFSAVGASVFYYLWGYPVEEKCWSEVPATTKAKPEQLIVLPVERQALGMAGGRPLESMPSVKGSTILFLHVFKCAGTSLREVLVNWAKSEGCNGAVAVWCSSMKRASAEKICLDSSNKLIPTKEQQSVVTHQKLIAGHFFWGFQQHVKKPYLMITTLRNPLELFVSGQQFKHREQTTTLEASVTYMTTFMQDRLGEEDLVDIGFLRRFVENSNLVLRYNPKNGTALQEANALATEVVANLNTFLVVGVVEQYAGFFEVLKQTLDPQAEHPDLWVQSQGIKNNGSPVHSGEVLQHLDPELVARYNATVLGLQWEVYDIALGLWDSRCREILPQADHDQLCVVPR